MTNIINRYELTPIKANVKSYYRKAFVEEVVHDLYGYCKNLYSYDTLIAEYIINDQTLKINTENMEDTFTLTTLRHLKEFMLQNGFKPVNKPKIRKLAKENDSDYIALNR